MTWAFKEAKGWKKLTYMFILFIFLSKLVYIIIQSLLNFTNLLVFSTIWTKVIAFITYTLSIWLYLRTNWLHCNQLKWDPKSRSHIIWIFYERIMNCWSWKLHDVKITSSTLEVFKIYNVFLDKDLINVKIRYILISRAHIRTL